MITQTVPSIYLDQAPAVSGKLGRTAVSSKDRCPSPDPSGRARGLSRGRLLPFSMGLLALAWTLLALPPVVQALSGDGLPGGFSDGSRIPSAGSLWSTWFARGVAALDKGRADEALEKFRTALLLNPGCREIVNNIGVAYFRKRKFDTAEEIFIELLAKEPDFIEPRVNLGLIYYEQGRWDDILKQAEMVLAITPDRGVALFGKGVALFHKGDFRQSAKCLEMSLNGSEDSAEYFSEARSYLRRVKARLTLERTAPWEGGSGK